MAKKKKYSLKCCRHYSLETGCDIYYWCPAIVFNGGIDKYKFEKIPCYKPED